MTAAGLALLLLGKLAIGAALFTVVVSFGMWIGRVSFFGREDIG